MPLYRPNKQEYIAAVKALRHGFEDPITGESTGKVAIGFEARDGYDIRHFDSWTPSQKSQITKLYNLVDHLTARPFYVYRGRKSENIRLMQEVAQHEQFPKQLKVAFLPSPARIKPKIRITKSRQVVIKQGRITRRSISLEQAGLTPQDFALDPKTATIEAINQLEPGKSYQIRAGKYLIKTTHSAKFLPREVAKLVQKYGADSYDASDLNSSYFGNWLNGFEVYDYERLTDFNRFAEKHRQSREALQDERKAARKAWRKKYGSRLRKKRGKRK